MSDSYQAIYDAVRSKITGANVGEAIQQAICDQNWAHYIQQVAQDWQNAAAEQQRPCVLFKPSLFKDGNEWCALLGQDIQVGVAGFGKTPQEAMYNFDIEWTKP